jgi:hypothetical protein
MRFDPDKHRAYQTFESACRARNCDVRNERANVPYVALVTTTSRMPVRSAPAARVMLTRT